MPPRPLKYACAVAAFSALLGVGASASASLSLSAGVYPRRNGAGQQRLATCQAQTSGCPAPNNCGINKATCYDGGSTWTFSFIFDSLSFTNMMVFGATGSGTSTGAGSTGGISCAQYANRVAASGQTPPCHLIAVFSYGDVVGHEFSISDAAIVAGFEGIGTNGDPTSVDRGQVCAGNAADMDPTLSTLSFFLTNSNDPNTQNLGGQAADGDEYTYNIYWDVVGPAAPQGLSVEPADTAVQLSWSSTSSANPSSSSGTVTVAPPCLLGYQAYAVPMPFNGVLPDGAIFDGAFNPADTSVSEGGTDSTVAFDTAPAPMPDTAVDGTDALDETLDTTPATDTATSADTLVSTTDATTGDSSSTSTDPACATSPLNAYTTAPPDPQISGYANGGATNASSTSKRVDGLTNYVVYSLSIGGTDTFGNVGMLATPVCAEPKETSDFFDAYREAGGLGGGGYCNFGRSDVGVVGGSIGLVALLGLASRRARRRGDKGAR